MYKYLTILISTHYVMFSMLYFIQRHSHTYTHLGISKEQNAARQFIIFTLLKFSSRDEGDIKQLQQRAAQAVGRGNQSWPAKTQNSRVAKISENDAVGHKKNDVQVVQKLWPKSETMPGKRIKI